MRFLSILTVAAVLALPAQASAQNNTGGAGWSVSVFDAGNNLLGSYTPYAPAGGHPSVWVTTTV